MSTTILAHLEDGSIVDTIISCLRCHAENHFYGVPPHEDLRCVSCGMVLTNA